MNDFDWDAHQKKLIAQGARHKKKPRKGCTLPSDYMTPAQKRKQNGEVQTMTLNKPITWAELNSYPEDVQREYQVDVSQVIGFAGFGGPYSFRESQSLTLKLLTGMLFAKGYDRRNAEPWLLMSKNHIPMLLIQSTHDGLIQYECAQDFAARAEELGNTFELYSVEDKKNTHSWYTAGLFLETREENRTLDKFFSWIEELGDFA